MKATEPQGAEAWAQMREHSRSPAQLRKQLQEWMRSRLGDSQCTVQGVTVPAGTGVANETLLIEVERSTGAIDGFVARLAAPEPLYLDYDLHKHFQMNEVMASISTVPTPAVVGYEADSGVLGAPFFVMEKVDGAVPTDNPPWWTEGFVVDATPAQRRKMWEGTVRVMAELHSLDPAPFQFLRTGAAADGVGDALDHSIRTLQWVGMAEPIPLADDVRTWLLANRPPGTALSWGDSRLPNVIYRDHTPVALLDWDLVSLAGPQADLAWWIIMTPPDSLRLDGIGTNDELVDVWESLSATPAADLHWFLVFAAYRLAGILAKLFAMFVDQGRMPAEVAVEQLRAGLHVQLFAGLLGLTPPQGVSPVVPDVRLDRS